MHSPSVALGWEIWRRHRSRLIAVVGMLLGFALLYPKLCALAGFNPDTADALDEFARKMESITRMGPTPPTVAHLLYLIFLVGGPAAAMLVSLLCVTWMFTFLEFNPNAKDPVAFPSRIFALPISTSFLFWWLLLAGTAAIVVLFECWAHLVRQPRLEVFGEYQKCLGWITLLALAQGIVWAMAAWPIARLLVLSAVMFCFLGSPTWAHLFECPLVLPTLFLLGAVLARISLQKMRHGQWQGWIWKWPVPAILAAGELRGPRRFSSPAQAQLWFEWRRFARRSCWYVGALVVVPVVIHLMVRGAFGLGPLQDDTVFGFTLCLVGAPLLVHFTHAIAPGRTDQPFLMIRPVTEGAMTFATLKAAAISTAVSWVTVFVALAGMPMLGDFHAVERRVSELPECRAAIVIGLIFLTWRVVAVSYCFARSGNRRLATVPILMLLALYAGGIILSVALHGDYWPETLQRLIPFVPSLLAGLVAVKLLLTFLGFRMCLARRLVTPSEMAGYLVVWIVLVGVLLAVALILPRPSKQFVLPLTLSVVLIVPLARIAFSPIALAHSRHT